MRTPDEEKLLSAAKGNCASVEREIIEIADGWLDTDALQQLISGIGKQTNPNPGASYEVASRMYAQRENLLIALLQFVESDRGKSDE